MEIRTTVSLPVSPQRAWVALADRFGDIASWASSVTASSLDGPVAIGVTRTCEIAGFGPFGAGAVRERLVELDPSSRCLTYEVSAGLPGMLESARNRWRIEASPIDPGACVVHSHATLELRRALRWLAPMLRWQLRGRVRRALEEFAHFAETGSGQSGLPEPGRAGLPNTG
jgi:hypothetical protein